MASTIARRERLFAELASIGLANEKALAISGQLVTTAQAQSDPDVLAAVKLLNSPKKLQAAIQVIQQLLQAASNTDGVQARINTVQDLSGTYKDLYAEIEADAAANPSDLVFQLHKRMKDGFIADAAGLQPALDATQKTVSDAATNISLDLKVAATDVAPAPIGPISPLPPVIANPG